MSVTVTLSATTAADRKGLQAIVAAYAGETVTLTEDGFGSTTGTLTVGEYRDASEFGSDGFTVTVTDGRDFVGTGVWGDDACGTLANRTRLVVG